MDRSVWDAIDTSSLPENLKNIEETRSLQVTPKADAHVFCRAVEDCEPLSQGMGDEITLDAGDVALLRYRLIQDLVRDGRVVLT